MRASVVTGSRVEIQRDVHGAGAVSEGADADEVHAGFGDGTDGGEVDAATRFGFRATGDQLDRRTEQGRGHVVEQDDVSAGSDGLFDLFERVRFDFDL